MTETFQDSTVQTLQSQVAEARQRKQETEFKDFQRWAKQLADQICETLGTEFAEQLGIRFYSPHRPECRFQFEGKEIKISAHRNRNGQEWLEFAYSYREGTVGCSEDAIEFLVDLEGWIVEKSRSPEDYDAFPTTESHSYGLTKLEYFTAALLQGGQMPEAAIAKARRVIDLLHPPAPVVKEQSYSLSEVLAFEVEKAPELEEVPV